MPGATRKAAPVLPIPTRSISPNPHNPRRLFDDEPMQILEESIDKLGILVPVTVYEQRAAARPGQHQYVLLDGERRWRCAQKLKLSSVPAIVVEEPTDERNILTMFHIHNVREGWQLMPTALKLQVLMVKLDETREAYLAELTKLSVSQIRRCKILLTFPKSIQNLMLAPPSERFKADFFIEMQRIRGPAREARFPPWIERGDLKCIHILIDKYERKVIEAVTDFRLLAEIYHGSVRIKKEKTFFKALDKFLDDPERRIDQIDVSGATYAKEAKEIRRSASRLLAQLEDINLEDISAENDVIELLRRLSKTIRAKLENALLVRPRGGSSDSN